MTSLKFNWRPEGRNAIDKQVQEGLMDAAEAVVPMARAILAPHRHTGQSADTIRVGSDFKRQPFATFVASRSGDSFFIHEGTSDTAPIPFLSTPLDTIAKRVPHFIRNRDKGGLAGLNTSYRGEFGITRTED
jgi:hypothetical protein